MPHWSAWECSAVELGRNLKVRSGKPDPLAANIVHVGEDRCDGADLAGRFGWRLGCQYGWRFRFPDDRVKVFDKKLVDAIIGSKDLDRSWAELSGCHGWSLDHGSLLLDLGYFRAATCGWPTDLRG
jgi:hypothetical protein